MARYKRKPSIFAAIIRAPWWVGISGAVITWLFFWVVLHHIHLPGWQTNVFVGQLDLGLHTPVIRHVGWLFIAFFLLGSGCSAYNAHERGQLLEQQRDLNSIKSMSWQAFERVVGEAYKRLGYKIDETGQGGADGGVDLVLRRDGQKIIVQCKRWQTNSVGASVVREMFGLMAHHGASGVKVVCAGHFTKDAIEFAQGKPIELVSGDALIALIGMVQTRNKITSSGNDEVVTCPGCGGPMVKRFSKKTSSYFMGCTAYPKCKGIRTI